MTNQKKVIILVIGVLIILFAFNIVGEEKENTNNKGRVTGTVNFTDVETEYGNDFNPDDYKDKNVIITFVNSGCSYCDTQVSNFNKLKDDNDFELFYIPTNETDKQTISKLDALGAKDYNILIDRGHGLKKRLGVKTVPTSIIKRAGEDKFEAVVGVIEGKSSQKDSKILTDYIE